MTINISTQLYDIEGVEHFARKNIQHISDKITRRITSTATLDGSSYVSDQGYSDADRLLNFEVTNLSKERVENILRITKLHSVIWVCTIDGAYLASISKAYYSNNTLKLNIIIRGGA